MGILDDEEDQKEQKHVTFRCPAPLITRLERAAASARKNRSRTIVRLLEYALSEWEKEDSQKKTRR